MNAERNIEIEYLRGIAVVMAAVSHLPVLLPFYNDNVLLQLFSVYIPWTGVDLFFCISGYVVAMSFVGFIDKHKSEGHFWLAAQCFWIRRIFRLLPSAWAWMIIGILLSVFFNHTGLYNTLYQNVRSASVILTFSGNFANQFGMLLTPNDVYWSLALEEQFYLLFPLFLLITPIAWRWRILLSLIALQFFLDRNPFATFFTSMAWSVRLDAMMWGILIFIFSKSAQYRLFEPVFLKQSRLTALSLNALLFYLLGAIPTQLIAMPIAIGLIAIVSAILVLMASYQAKYICNIPFTSGILNWIGTRSYAIYLAHMPCYRASYEAWFRYTKSIHHPLDATYAPLMVLTAVILIAVMAELNFRLLENPLRQFGIALSAKRLKRLRGSNAGQSGEQAFASTHDAP